MILPAMYTIEKNIGVNTCFEEQVFTRFSNFILPINIANGFWQIPNQVPQAATLLSFHHIIYSHFKTTML
jgi:hypothetical protein